MGSGTKDELKDAVRWAVNRPNAGFAPDARIREAGIHDTRSRPARAYGVPAPAADTRAEDIYPRAGASAGLEQALLERTVENSVITALLQRHRALHLPVAGEQPGFAPSSVRERQPDAETDFDRFVARLAEGDREGAIVLLAPLRHPLGLLDDRVEAVLAAASRRLGSAWEEDRLSFAEVSLGLVTLQRLLHEFASPPRSVPLVGRRMLLLPMPGETHCFGLRLLGIRLAQAGWDCQCESALPEAALLHRVAAEPYDVVALSVQDRAGVARAPALIARLRLASRVPHPLMLLGGAPFVDAPAKALAAGADLPALPFPELREALAQRLPLGEG